MVGSGCETNDSCGSVGSVGRTKENENRNENESENENENENRNENEPSRAEPSREK